jgi:hypothetical protein
MHSVSVPLKSGPGGPPPHVGSPTSGCTRSRTTIHHPGVHRTLHCIPHICAWAYVASYHAAPIGRTRWTYSSRWVWVYGRQSHPWGWDPRLGPLQPRRSLIPSQHWTRGFPSRPWTAAYRTYSHRSRGWTQRGNSAYTPTTPSSSCMIVGCCAGTIQRQNEGASSPWTTDLSVMRTCSPSRWFLFPATSGLCLY